MTLSLETATSVHLHVDAAADHGPVELWRHTVGVGGINSLPLPERVVAGARALRPRLVRVFLQQFFDVYPDHDTYDWDRLDAYLDSVAGTGADVVAAICLKPPVLFPTVDHRQWRPNDTAEWQRLITALVHRYSVERRQVTHWEVGNETDIGEDGGAPYLIPDPDDYTEFFLMTASAIRAAAPEVKVGGPAACWVTNEPLPGFVARCAEAGTPVDFVSWHLYADDEQRHALGAREGAELIRRLPAESRPELMVTEWSKSFEPWSVPDQGRDAARAALTVAAVLAMHDERLDWSFYYHLWDQFADPEDFRPFFSAAGIDNMYRHWNEVPHRFGLFAEDGTPRPQYFAFRLLGLLGSTRISAPPGTDPSLPVTLHHLSTRSGGSVTTVLANTEAVGPGLLTAVHLSGLRPGVARVRVHRVDDERRWDEQTLELRPLEERRVALREDFECQLHLPPGSVTLLTLDPLDSLEPVDGPQDRGHGRESAPDPQEGQR